MATKVWLSFKSRPKHTFETFSNAVTVAVVQDLNVQVNDFETFLSAGAVAVVQDLNVQVIDFETFLSVGAVAVNKTSKGHEQQNDLIHVFLPKSRSLAALLRYDFFCALCIDLIVKQFPISQACAILKNVDNFLKKNLISYIQFKKSVL